MMTKDVRFTSGKEQLAGRLFSPSSSSPEKGVLFLHGAGQATKERAEPIVERLCEGKNVASFTFDFSGHGESSGTLKASSIKKRVSEAKSALEASEFQQPISVCASSMGGHIALELLQHFDVQGLTLFYPAVYAKEAVDLAFGDPLFSETIRRERSWLNSDAFTYLRNFTGSLLVVAGEKDNVIPREIIDLIMSNAISAQRKRLIVLEDAPHLLLPVLYERQEIFGDVCDTIAHFSVRRR